MGDEERCYGRKGRKGGKRRKRRKNRGAGVRNEHGRVNAILE